MLISHEFKKESSSKRKVGYAVLFVAVTTMWCSLRFAPNSFPKVILYHRVLFSMFPAVLSADQVTIQASYKWQNFACSTL